MSLCVFAISWNEAQMMPFFLKHYSTFADKIVVFDEFSTDGTREIVKEFPKAELRDWPFKGLDDEKFLAAVNQWWKEARGKFDWVMWPDVDELLWARDPFEQIRNANGSVIASVGYAVISKTGWPVSGQMCEQVKTGVRQENYDKQILWRSDLEMVHTIGRHTYPGQFPRHNGRVATNTDFKLLHCHHVGGITDTEARNKRNFDRAVDKKFAWNYSPDHNRPLQNGSAAWVAYKIAQNQIMEIPGMTTDKVKINVGCGDNRPAGWDNYDSELDISLPLPFRDGSVDFILAEHVVEHVTTQQAWKFFEECKRVLVPGGVLRVAIPDIERIWCNFCPEYGAAVKAGGHGDGGLQTSIRAAIFEHGHKAAWTAALLKIVLESVGFKVQVVHMGKSNYPELCNVEGHGRVVGDKVARTETSVVEATK